MKESKLGDKPSGCSRRNPNVEQIIQLGKRISIGVEPCYIIICMPTKSTYLANPLGYITFSISQYSFLLSSIAYIQDNMAKFFYLCPMPCIDLIPRTRVHIINIQPCAVIRGRSVMPNWHKVLKTGKGSDLVTPKNGLTGNLVVT